eukprot:CAMPEP_0115765798 /NCGR_PEP_ID=MMETSP0272-20121206/102780_1 /TAXON_ID=71861 /ORGANISM="Scrippsiella trochoidea, Strain CCMP3099" /LENGTH=204 /DNA_ID=CAMNT_0003211665 /DNA_START=59 /DNA_END=670 /DNA_ORIENTATION=-
MPHIGVLFEIRRAETRPGECVSVVGSRPELGNWDPFDYKAAAGLGLRTSAVLEEQEDLPSSTVPDSPAAGTGGAATSAGGSGGSSPGDAYVRLEYKYVKDRRQMPDGGPSIQWEECIANRRVMIPREHGSIWIVSDLSFNQNSEPQLVRTTLAEVLLRRGDLDPEWTSRDADAPEWSMPHQENLSSPGSVATSCSRHTTSTILM